MPESGGTCLPSENTILQDATTRFVGAADNHALDEAKAFFLGKNGQLQTLLRGLPSLPAKERPAVGKQLNALREKIEQLYQEGRDRLRKEKMQRTLSQKIDVTLPGRQIESGGLHPLSLATERAENIFSSIGFGIADGPEIETDYYNFTALNHPPDHPARSMHDTFYTSDGRLLRTHTSPVQIRHMLSHSAPPIRAIAPGRVYRCDHDATHSPMFHQIEGIWIDDTVTFTGLKGVLGAFFRAFFDDDDIALRFRPSYFPFTEPSAECDIRRSDGDWLEVAGCGMIHPNVLVHGGVDNTQYRGFAFGVGVERLAMLLYGVTDIRQFYENDLRFLKQFASE
ncbi:phenylalanine--tRNA ligase subunit alpha [Candidatus Persebacteraceae bacterium Df01]|jgi:phenylalanyl-tRNA synthetase alpha chain|uniref:Phenylalanine--tRNA ligase alpha subunit n=1 Tax=Candidatus Doriopsillibacter californiensis TaxID=2970740 RepID=A0ABT7QLB1_9GAMM|nr:phenylalanine--tRNA ligase subunit alpha [Candidatus Persebacteraceae bacterium Df01]